MSKWIEQGTCNQRPGETLVAIEQEGFGIVCAVLDYEGGSVYRILRAMNSHNELLTAGAAIVEAVDTFHQSGRPLTLDVADKLVRDLRNAVCDAEGCP